MERHRTVAITPIVGGASLKGPTVQMMRAVGADPNPVEVARIYRDIAVGFVLDGHDQGLAPELDRLGFRTLVTDTVMTDGGGRLAARILEAFT
jgi:LPPG:FO 2-phospho-L-lactate transferase